MAIISIITLLALGTAVGFIVSVVNNMSPFNTAVNLISGALGAVLAGELVPNTHLISPEYAEQFLRGAAGAFVLILAIGIIRKV